jgi:hypothetical protein
MAQPSVTAAREECNKYDVIAAPSVSDWPIIVIRPGSLLLLVSHSFAVSAAEVENK